MIFDFASRFKTAFGFVAGNVASRLASTGFGDVQKVGDNYGLTVYNGRDAAFDEVTLKKGVNGPSYLFAYRSLAEDYNNVFATPPMLRMSRAKRLVVSVIDNSDLEVVERYSTEPWEISLRGLLIDMVNHEFPLDKLQTMNEIFEVNSIWTVSSEIINAIGVDAIYIKDIEIEFVEGYEDTIAYTMTTRAIKPLEYQLIKK